MSPAYPIYVRAVEKCNSLSPIYVRVMNLNLQQRVVYMRVFCYWNLHKGQFSVKALDGPNKGRVIARAGLVYLVNVTPRVSEAGRQRVLRERKKNVHSGIVGELIGYGPALDAPEGLESATELFYNPYKVTTFVDRESQQRAIEGASWALLNNKRVFVGGDRVWNTCT